MQVKVNSFDNEPTKPLESVELHRKTTVDEAALGLSFGLAAVSASGKRKMEEDMDTFSNSSTH